jgi:hypothetical protein
MSLSRYINCDNAYEDLLSLIKKTLTQDDEGNLYFRITAADEDLVPVSILTEVECGDNDSLEDILRKLLMIDDETGEISWAVYNVSE